MTVKPSDNVVRLIELRAQDGAVLEARLDARRVREEYVAAVSSLEHFGADADAVGTAESYRQLIARLDAVDAIAE